MKKILSTFFVFCILNFGFLAQADKDLEYQNRIHQIYLKHYKDPISHDAWASAIDSLDSSYKLKHKDNLWDLSGKFFNKNLYWSKLWVANPTIENPHLIYKGNSINFDKQALVAVNQSKFSVDLSEQFPGLKIPENPYSRRSLREDEIPSSLSVLTFKINEGLNIDVDLKFLDFRINRDAILPSYISKNSITGIGTVVEKNGYGSLSMNGEDIVVSITGGVSLGSFYTVMESRKLSRSLLGRIFGKSYQNIIKGEIEIISHIVKGEPMYLARVVKSLHPISKGDVILSGRTPFYTLSQQGRHGSSSGGRIIGTQNLANKMLGLYSIVYLSKGASSDLHVDELYYIKAKPTKNKLAKNRPYKDNIGQMRIVHMTPDRATAIITQAQSPIFVGDYFGTSDTVLDLDQSDSHEAFIEDQKPDQEILEVQEEDFEQEEEEFNEELEEDTDSELEQEGEGEFEEEFEEGEDLEEEFEEDEDSELESDENVDVIKDEFEEIEDLDSELDD